MKKFIFRQQRFAIAVVFLGLRPERSFHEYYLWNDKVSTMRRSLHLQFQLQDAGRVRVLYFLWAVNFKPIKERP